MKPNSRSMPQMTAIPSRSLRAQGARPGSACRSVLLARISAAALVACFALSRLDAPLFTTAVLAAQPDRPASNTPIPDSRFPTYVKFAADPDNYGRFSGQARVDGVPAALKPPIFFAGFFRPEDFQSFGMLVSFGNQGSRGYGLLGLSTQGNGLLAFQWSGPGWQRLNLAPGIWNVGGQQTAMKLNQWSFIALVVNDSRSRSI